MKTCSKCKKQKKKSSFYKDNRTKDGLYSSCKDCHILLKIGSIGRLARLKNDPTPPRVASYMFSGMTGRINNYEAYKNTLICFTKKEFVDYISKNWETYMSLFKRWENSKWNRGLAPSIDRVDTKGHYSLNNIQIITAGENARKAQIYRWHKK